MVADALHDRAHAGVPDAEALAGHAADVGLAGRGSVQRDVSGDDVLLRHESRVAIREQDNLAAREALAHVVIGVALEGQGDALGHEGTEALAG